MANLNEIYLTDKAHYKDYIATASGDLGTDSGDTNLSNALFRRLITSKGAIIHRPNYGVGIKDFQNGLNTLSKQREIALLIGEQFPLDPRVQSVDGVSVNVDVNNPDRTTITVKITPIGKDQTTLTFAPFEGG